MKYRLGLKLLSMQDFGLKNNNSFYKTFEILTCVKAIKDFFYIFTNSYKQLKLFVNACETYTLVSNNL